MRTASLAAVALAIFGIVACKDDGATIDYGLTEDLALAASDEGLNLAPAGANRGTVSALEQIPRSTLRSAPAQRVHTYRPAAARRVEAPAPPEPEAQRVEVTEVEIADATVESPAAANPAPAAAEPAPAPAPRPHPVPIDLPNPADVGRGPQGTIVVIRGGTVDGDHCDLRTDRRRSGIHISINNRIPTPTTF